MIAPQWAGLDQRKNRLARRGAKIPEVNHALRARWIEYQTARGRTSPSPASREALDRLLDALFEPGAASDPWGSDALLRLRRALNPNPGTALRDSPAPPLAAGHRPPPPEFVAKALERFEDWLATPSFAELHPIVQMSLAQARLLEIHPFADPAEAVATAFASRFPLRAGYLLPIPAPGDADRFSEVLEAAFQLSTEAIVQFNLNAALSAYDAADRLLGI